MVRNSCGVGKRKIVFQAYFEWLLTVQQPPSALTLASSSPSGALQRPWVCEDIQDIDVRERERETDRKTDRHTHILTDGQTYSLPVYDRQTDRQTDRQMGRQTQKHSGGSVDIG